MVIFDANKFIFNYINSLKKIALFLVFDFQIKIILLYITKTTLHL
jgi:hypothetical protein